MLKRIRKMTTTSFARSVLLGVAAGDALGVPVEFVERVVLARRPVVDMRAQGSHNQLAGTWSDDSSLTFCLAEMLCRGYDLKDLANRLVNWKEYNYWTPRGCVFDIGIATTEAINRLEDGCDPKLAGGRDEMSNGNGSLMRILPLIFFMKDKPVYERFRCVQDVSSLTHGHIRSVLACFIYTEFALQLMAGRDKHLALLQACKAVNELLQLRPLCPDDERALFTRILDNPAGLAAIAEDDIATSGYVVHTLEASIWCLLQTSSYKDAVLKAVNLGSDTDTTGAVTGGLAGLLYGAESIPAEWLAVLARSADIEDLAARLSEACRHSESSADNII